MTRQPLEKQKRPRTVAKRWAGLCSTVFVLVWVVASNAQANTFDHSHSTWTRFLGSYVSNGNVDYAGIRARGQSDLYGHLSDLEAVSLDQVERFSDHEKLAFWINAYNAYTIKLILDHYPLDSIRDIGFLPGAAFREEFIPLGHDDELALNDIEHEILREEFSEPRIHFALVCAAKSCPLLRSEAYRAADLDSQLDDQAKRFINNRKKNYFDSSSNTLHLSAIFKWFEKDFTGRGRSLAAYVSRYLNAEVSAAVNSTGTAIEYLDYDWSLNGR